MLKLLEIYGKWKRRALLRFQWLWNLYELLHKKLIANCLGKNKINPENELLLHLTDKHINVMYSCNWNGTALRTMGKSQRIIPSISLWVNVEDFSFCIPLFIFSFMMTSSLWASANTDTSLRNSLTCCKRVIYF